jgi:hypothetical protein
MSPSFPPKRRVFVSYHHGGDRIAYEKFVDLFAAEYEVLRDNSVERIIDSDKADYVIRKIREDYITGSSCTIVLCGEETHQRKFVDWEIKATLDACHGLIGIGLPTAIQEFAGDYTIPLRLRDNVSSGYALWLMWEEILYFPWLLGQYIEEAKAKPNFMIRNFRELKGRNG